MARLLRAFFFKLKSDLTFRITLIIGIGLAIFLTLMYFAIDFFTAQSDNVPLSDLTNKMCTGQSMLINSFSPTQNFGLAIPINLITFISFEFTYGTIRNKIIAGNSKLKIYAALFLSGLFFSLSLITVYVLLCFGLGSLIGGFDPNGTSPGVLGVIPILTDWTFLLRFILLNLLCYITITSFTVFVATLIRHIGGAIPIVMIVMLFAYLIGSITSLITLQSDLNTEGFVWFLRFIDPLYGASSMEYEMLGENAMLRIVSNETLICGIVSNIFYTALFFVGGALIFNKRDVK